MHTPPSEPRHTRSYSTPNVRKRKSSATTAVPHHLLSTNTHLLHLARAPAVVDLIRLNSPSLASFTPYSESIDSQGPACGSLRAHMHLRSQSLSAIPTGAKSISIGMPAPSPPGDLQLLSHWEAGSSPIPSTASSPRSSSPPSSPSVSIPSLSRTHSTTASSSLPSTPPLPLTPLSARCHSKVRLKKKKSRETMPGRKRAPSLPVPWPAADQKRDCSPSCERVLSARERAFSAASGNTMLAATRSPDSPVQQQSLAALEASSKLMRTAVTCAICGMSGRDFPRCPRCGDAWCSRACRMMARKEVGKEGGEGIRGHGCRGSRTASG